MGEDGQHTHLRTTGQCACGQISVHVDGPARLSGLCHCTNCRRRTGSAFGWSVYVDREHVSLPDDGLTAFEVPIEPPQTRWFCTHCGTTLFWRTDALPDQIGLAAGCLADPPDGPQVTCQDSDRLHWVALPDGVSIMN